MTKIVIHYLADAAGKYLGTVALPQDQEVELDEGFVEVPSPPVRNDQTWNGERWAFPMRHYAGPDGVYAGEMEEGTAPAGHVETRGAPVDAADQIWAANQWQWKIHYYVDAAGKFQGVVTGSNRPADLIEVPSAPDDGRQIWDGKKWLALPIA